MAKKRNSMMDDMLDITTGSIFGGIGIGVIEQSPIPSPIRGGLSSLVGVKLLSDTSKKIKL